MDKIIETIAVPVSDYRKLLADLSYFKTKAKNRRKALKDLNVAQKHCNELIRMQMDSITSKTWENYHLRRESSLTAKEPISLSKWLKVLLLKEFTF